MNESDHKFPPPVFIVDKDALSYAALALRPVVIRLTDFNDMGRIDNIAGSIDLRGILVDCENKALSELEVPESLSRYTTFIHLDSLGDRLKSFAIMSRLGPAATVIFHGKERVTDARIAASLGLNSGIWLLPDDNLGEDVMEFADYHFYGRMSRGGVEPFFALENAYHPSSRLSPGLAYLGFPPLYFHVDASLNVAFTARGLRKGDYIGRGEEFITGLPRHECVEDAIYSWQRHLISPGACAVCPAFCICSGYFSCQSGKGDCRRLMTEVLDGIVFKKGGCC